MGLCMCVCVYGSVSESVCVGFGLKETKVCAKVNRYSACCILTMGNLDDATSL